jgi:hypothetical protein
LAGRSLEAIGSIKKHKMTFAENVCLKARYNDPSKITVGAKKTTAPNIAMAMRDTSVGHTRKARQPAMKS